MGDYTLVETPDGERRFTLDASAYSGCAVIAEGVDLSDDPDAELVDGAWTVPLAVLRRRQLEAVKDEQAMRFAMGWAHSFSVGDHVLDLRNADDKANWTLLLIKTNGMVAAGAGDVPVEIKTAFNAVIAVPAAEANAAMQAFLAWGEAMLKAKWALDSAVGAAADEAALATIDVAAGWP